VAMVYAASTGHDGTLLAAAAFAGGYVLLSVYSEFIFALYRVEEMMLYEATGRLARSIAYSVGGVALVAAGRGVVAILAWSCLVALGINLFAWRISRRLRGFSVRPALRGAMLRRTFLDAIPFGILAVLTTISFRVDALMIQAIRGSTDVGLYGAAYRTMEALLILPGILAVACLPVIARSIEGDAPAVMRLVNTVIRLLWSLAFPLAVGLWLLGRSLLRDVFGARYEEAHVVLALLGVTLVPLFASAMTSILIAASRRPQINTLIAAAMVVLNVALNAALIPSRGIDGAGVATLATESFGLLVGAVVIARTHGRIAWHRFALKPLLATGAMGGVIVPMHESLAAIPLYGLIYVGVLLLLRGLTREDLALLRGAVFSRSVESELVGLA
jgi:O-antigen/teichoic acid export membrane protein